ncbi:hypothetical protein [Streptomyces sp. NPDC001635]
MAARLELAEPEDRGRDWFRVRRPSSAQVARFSLAMVVAADLADMIPDRHAVALVVGAAALGEFFKGCVRRSN